MRKLFIILIPLFLYTLFFIKENFFDIYTVSSNSMNPLLKKGDVILIYKLNCRKSLNLFLFEINMKRSDIEKGSIYTFEYNNTLYIKRAIASDGDRIEMKEKKVLINGIEENGLYSLIYEDPMVYPNEYSELKCKSSGCSSKFKVDLCNRDNFYQYVVPDKSVFFLGDNRDNSLDSREIGSVSKKNIIGMYFFTILTSG